LILLRLLIEGYIISIIHWAVCQPVWTFMLNCVLAISLEVSDGLTYRRHLLHSIAYHSVSMVHFKTNPDKSGLYLPIFFCILSVDPCMKVSAFWLTLSGFQVCLLNGWYLLLLVVIKWIESWYCQSTGLVSNHSHSLKDLI